MKVLLSWLDNDLNSLISALCLCWAVDYLCHKQNKVIFIHYQSFLLQLIATVTFPYNCDFISDLPCPLRDVAWDLFNCLCIANSLSNSGSLNLFCCFAHSRTAVRWTMFPSTIATLQLCPLFTLAIFMVSTSSATSLLTLAHRCHMPKSLTLETS